MGSVTAQLQLLQQLEGQLLKLRRDKNFVDPALRDVRKQFRATAEAILLKNYRSALVRSQLSCLDFPQKMENRKSRQSCGIDNLHGIVGKGGRDQAMASLLSQTCARFQT